MNFNSTINFNSFATFTLSVTGHCIVQPSKISISVQERIINKISYESRAYESVDDKSLSWAMLKKTRKNETHGCRGQ